MTKQTKQLVIIGDSGVYGWGDREGGGWSERLRNHWMSIPDSPILYNLGIRGDGLEKVAARWSQEWVCRGELRRKVPDALILTIGLNDSARVGRPDGRPQMTTEAYRYGLMQLVKEIKKNTKVMIIGLTPVDESVMPFAGCLWYSNNAISIYESQIEETCLDLDIPFLPLHKSIMNEEDWISWIEPDGIHLNSMGHNWIFERVKRWAPLNEWAELETLEGITP